MNYSLEENTNEQDVYNLYNLDIDIIKIDKNILFKKYYKQVSIEKEKIDSLENTNQWDRLKKVGNPYELIYISNNKKRKNESISKYIPISRSYFKIWEIFHIFPFFEDIINNDENNIFAHLAEGPGGFMEATYNYNLKKHKTSIKNDLFYCITLQPTNSSIPDFNKIKKVFTNADGIHIEYGNLYVIEDVLKYIHHFSKKKAILTSADGGFDYSNNFNGQEINSCQIIFCEMVVALNILKKGGTFICKIFDIFSITMIQILYILSISFKTIYIYKPETSRPANSEKYLVCIDFKDNMTDLVKMNLLTILEKWNNMKLKKDECIIFKNLPMNNDFIQKLDEYNKLYMEKQIYFLNTTLELSKSRIEKDKYYKIIENQVLNAIQWCTKYDIEINKKSIFYKET